MNNTTTITTADKKTEFKNLCRMSQFTLKSHVADCLKELNYDVIKADGFVYAKGTVPVLLVAHLDTVHKTTCYEIRDSKGQISSPQGIGGDDRCGVFIILNIIQELHCSVLVCEDEEIGGIGARKFIKATAENSTDKYVDHLDVNYIIEFDRKGYRNAVFYRCDNKDFTKFIKDNTGYVQQSGSFSDISVIAPAAKIAAVNLACGYYDAHTTKEYVVYTEMMGAMYTAQKLIKTECEKPFEYIEQKYTPPARDSYFSDYYYDDLYGNSKKQYKQQTLTAPFSNKANDFALELTLELEVIWENSKGKEFVDTVDGNTKAECWAKFFMQNPNVCFDMITDWSFA